MCDKLDVWINERQSEDKKGLIEEKFSRQLKYTLLLFSDELIDLLKNYSGKTVKSFYCSHILGH